MSEAGREQRLDRFLAAHRESGWPVTIQRRVVFEAIRDRRDHPTAEQVYRAVSRGLPQISRMTVRRILSGFVSLGLVARTCHPGSAARFDAKTCRHHHLVCLDCGAIIDVEDPRLDRIPWPRVDACEFTIQDSRVEFLGRCARCRQKARAHPRKPGARRASASSNSA
ncbi:MAG TPA: transcriptional repressor [Candidatus Paceibacterota bacterium]|nr:transcriptional repressor [Verrucomicrobiota bacterium]HOX01977.1 transcriptional repressor [Verrucomicrobiota bacterium]HRZ44832.1 transcriptional repressor [Candidatus Paceibacterota bacterium]HRZ93834.1 transcriptional repressor [Candidatus Paceibacterota bacterium]